ncbi:MAG: peptide ABC transporter substrate-binding protein, partial [Treponema sp.]|nr:peptide ABC transporter substrate-binding protein [Treponema sp.]
MVKRIGFLLMGLTLIAMSVSANATRQPAQASGSQITLVLGSEPNTIDPALNSAVDGAIYLSHLFEGLYKYADNGQGRAQAVPGLAVRAPQKTVNADGTVTYVFTLRDNLKWSDGQPFTAKDIVFSWQRLVDPSTAADYSYMIDMVKNANEIMAGQVNKSQLGVRAINDKTLEVIITYDCPFFFEIMAFPAAFPVRESVINSAGDQWTFSPSTYISNGPYRLKEWVHNSYILVEKNPNYYAPVSGPDNIRFALMDDDNAMLAAFRNKEVDFMETPPVDEIPGLLASGELKVADYLGTYYVSINNQKAPFTDPRVRRAFSLAIDRNYIVEQITRAGQKPASGFVPSGLYDAAGAGSDFRQTGGNYYSIAKEDYNKNVAEAQRLLAEAGYPNGQGFPVVEYLYN